MRRSSWSFGRMFGNFGSKPRSKKRRGANPQNRRRFTFEPLEERSLLSLCLWTGGVGNYWNNANNWKDESNHAVLPATGDTLQFAASPRTTTINDLPAGMSFESIKFSANGFSLAGNDLTLTSPTPTDGIAVDSGVTGSAISLNVALAGALTVDVVGTGDLLTISGNLSGSNYLKKIGAGTLSLSGVNTYTGGTTINDGTLKVESDAALVQCGNGLLVNGVNAKLDLNGHSVTVGAVGLINGSIHSTAAATLTGSSYVVLNGTIDVALGNNAATMMKGTSGTVNLVGPNAWNPIFNGGGVDIQDGKLVLDYTGGTTPASTVLSDLTASYAGAPCFATGHIRSSTAAGSFTSLGWADNTTAKTVTVQRALPGDANLDGTVNSADLVLVIGSYNHAGYWAQGDFDYNGVINSADYVLVIGNYHQHLIGLPPKVMAIARMGANPTSADSVQFIVAFSEGVTGVDTGDFVLATSGTSGTIASVDCSSSNAVYLVTVNNVHGNGTLGLNLIDDNSIKDANLVPLVGNGTDDGSFTGDVYTVTGPFVWVGGGSDGYWSTAANWLGDVLPPVGSALYFGGTPSENGCCDDRTGTAFQSIEFASSGFSITGASALPLTGGITVDAGVADATISMNVTANAPIAVDVADADASLTISGVLSGSGSLTKTGGGTLALASDSHTGDTTVSAGTLLVGPLPSVFADSLNDGVTLNTALSNAVLVGDPGASGGTFALDVPGLTGGSVTLGPDGIMQWSPSTGCQSDTYSATATYTYSAGYQMRGFELTVEEADLPPVFDFTPTDADDIQHWTGHDKNLYQYANIPEFVGSRQVSIQLDKAFDREGQITYYEAILFGTRFAHSSDPHISGIALRVTARIILAWPGRNARKSATKTSRG